MLFPGHQKQKIQQGVTTMTLFDNYGDIEERPKLKRINTYRLKMVKEATNLYSTNTVRCPADAADIMTKFYEEADREILSVILLNVKNKVIGINEVSVGSLTASVMHPREIFKCAILGNAAAIMLAHNHPSGDTSPSREDIEITKIIKDAGKLMDIPLIDHIIIGDNQYTSLKEHGYI